MPFKQRFIKYRVLPVTLDEPEGRNGSMDFKSAASTSSETITNKKTETSILYEGGVDDPSRTTLKMQNKVTCYLKLKSSLFAIKPRANKQYLREQLEEAQDHIGNMIKQLGHGMHWWGSFL